MAFTNTHILPDGRKINYSIHCADGRTVYEVNGNFFEFALSKKTLVNLPTEKMLTEMYRFRPDDPSDECSSLITPVIVSVWDNDTFVID